VRLAEGDALPFDYLIVATGATHSYFGHEDWAPVAPGLKTLEDAIEIRSRVLLAYEAAERSTDGRRTARAADVRDRRRRPQPVSSWRARWPRSPATRWPRIFAPSIRRRRACLLVEGQARVLPPYPETLSASAARQLAKLGVEVRVGARVQAVDGRRRHRRGRAHRRPHG